MTHADIRRQATNALLHALDPVIWAQDCLGFTCDPWQATLLRSDAKQTAVRVSRQAGKTTVISLLVAHTALFHPASTSVITSATQRQAGEMLRKVHSCLTHPKVNARLIADAVTSLELANGSRVLSLPASPEAVRGSSAPRVIVTDEAAYCPDDLHLALRPMAAASPRCKFILLGTPAGRTGHFYEACRSEFWEHYHITAHDIPGSARRSLSKN